MNKKPLAKDTAQAAISGKSLSAQLDLALAQGETSQLYQELFSISPRAARLLDSAILAIDTQAAKQELPNLPEKISDSSRQPRAFTVSPVALGRERVSLRLVARCMRKAVCNLDLSRQEIASILWELRNTIQAFGFDSFAQLRPEDMELAEALYKTLRGEILLGKLKLLATIDREQPFKVSALRNGSKKVPALISYCVLLRLVGDSLLLANADGTFIVPPFDIDLLLQACFRRLDLELKAALRLVCKSRQVDLERLYELNRCFLTNMDEESLNLSTNAIDRDLEFHEGLVSLAGMSQAVPELRADHHKMILWNCTIPAPKRRAAIHSEHCQILDAIRSGDRKLVVAAYQNHFRFATFRGLRDTAPSHQSSQFDQLWRDRLNIFSQTLDEVTVHTDGDIKS